MHNHHFLQLTGKPSWLSVKGGRYVTSQTHPPSHGRSPGGYSQKYVERIIKRLPADRVHLSTPIRSVSSSASGVRLTTAAGAELDFDHVVLATHTDTSLELLRKGSSGVTEVEREVLGAVKWTRNTVVVHHDEKAGFCDGLLRDSAD